MSDPVSAGSDLTALYAMVGTVVVGQAAAGIVGIVKWLGSRTVEREDREKEDFKAELKAHDARFAAVEQLLNIEIKAAGKAAEERFEEIEQSLRDMDRTVLTVQTDIKAVSSAVESIRSTVVELRAALENRFDKQSEFYRSQMKEVMGQVTEKLEKVEYDLRQDTTRAITEAKLQLAASSKRKS